MECLSPIFWDNTIKATSVRRDRPFMGVHVLFTFITYKQFTVIDYNFLFKKLFFNKSSWPWTWYSPDNQHWLWQTGFHLERNAHSWQILSGPSGEKRWKIILKKTFVPTSTKHKSTLTDSWGKQQRTISSVYMELNRFCYSSKWGKVGNATLSSTSP